MANAFRIDPSLLGINWQTSSTYRIAITPGFVRETTSTQQLSLANNTASIFTTFATVITATSITPAYNTTASITGTFSIIYDRKVKNYGTNTNWYLYEETTTTDILLATIPANSNIVNKNNRTITLDIKNYLEPFKTYYVTADEGVVKDIYNFKNVAIVDDTFYKFNTGYAATITATNYLNFNLNTSSGVTKFVRLLFSESVSTGTGNVVVYNETGTVYHSWNVIDNYGVQFNSNEVLIRTNFYNADVAPEGTYYIGYDTGVINGISSSTVALNNPNKIRWTQSILQNMGARTFNSGTNYLFTGTNPNIIFTEGVVGTATNRLLTLKLSSLDGQFGHATTGTTSGTFWIVTGTEASLNGLWNNITFNPSLLWTTTYHYELSYSAGILATGTNALNYAEAQYIFPAQIGLQVTTDAYKGTGAPYVKDETITFTASLTTSTQLLENFIFRIDGISVASVPVQYAGGVNTAQTTTSFATSGTRQIEVIWEGGLYNSTLYAGQNATQNITVIDGYTLDAPINISASTPRIYDEPITFTATVTTSSIMANTLTFFANSTELGSAQFNTLTNTAVLTATIATTGTYTISANWSGGYIDDNRYYLPKAANTASITVELARTLGVPIEVTLSDDIVSDVSTLWATQPSFTATAVINTSSVLTATITFEVQRLMSNRIILNGFTPSVWSATTNLYMSDAVLWLNTTSGMSPGFLFTIRSYDNQQINDFTVTNVNTVANTVAIRETNLPTYRQQYADPLHYVVNGNHWPSYSTVYSSSTVASFVPRLDLLNFWVDPAPKVPLNPEQGVKIGPYEYYTATIANNSASISIPIVENYFGSNFLTTGVNVVANFNGQSVVPRFYPKKSTTSTFNVYEKTTPRWLYDYYRPTVQVFYRNNLNGTVATIMTLTGTIIGNAEHPPTGTVTLRWPQSQNVYSGNSQYFYGNGDTRILGTGAITNGVFTATWVPDAWLFGTDAVTPAGAGQYIEVTHNGDDYNNSSTGYMSFEVRTKRNTNLTFTTTTATLGRPNTFQFVVQTTSTYFNGSTIRFKDNNVVIGTSTVTNTTATFTYASSTSTLGGHTLLAEFSPETFAYNYASTSTSFTIT